MSDSFKGQDRLSSCERRWYVVSTKPNHEKQVDQSIRCMDVECFLPLLQEEKMIRQRIRTVTAPLFPGYLFVRINLSEHYRVVNYARGVRKILEFGSCPVEVDVALVEAIKSRMNPAKVCVLDRKRELKSGELVQIGEGPLVGLDAVFMREMPGQQRAMVLLHTLAIRARIVLDISQLIPYAAA